MPKPVRRSWTFLLTCAILCGSLGPASMAAVQLGSVTFLGVSPRIFTPNGDRANDKAVFHFENPDQAFLAGEIFDLSGGRVAALAPGNDPFLTLLWDGRDYGGSQAPAGIYLYQITVNGKVATGTVVIAR